jgi:hypothetical protein
MSTLLDQDTNTTDHLTSHLTKRSQKVRVQYTHSHNHLQLHTTNNRAHLCITICRSGPADAGRRTAPTRVDQAYDQLRGWSSC